MRSDVLGMWSAVAAGSLSCVASASTVLYSNAINQSAFMSGYITNVTEGPMGGTGNPATVIVPFRTAGSVGDQGWILETMRIWTTDLAPLGANQQPTFRIFADDPANRPSILNASFGQRFFAANTNNLTQIFSWQTQFADAVDTRDLNLPTGDPGRSINYTYNVATPLELDAGTLYWFAITAERATVWSNFGWRQTANAYNPDGFDITSQMFELSGSAIPAPGAIALLGAAGLVGGRRRRN